MLRKEHKTLTVNQQGLNGHDQSHLRRIEATPEALLMTNGATSEMPCDDCATVDANPPEAASGLRHLSRSGFRSPIWTASPSVKYSFFGYFQRISLAGDPE